MGILSTTKRSARWFFGFFFNVKAWFGYDSIKRSGHYIGSLTKALLYRPKPLQEDEKFDSFDTVVAEMQLSEEDLEKRARGYLWQSWFFLVLATAVATYAVYLLFWRHAYFSSLAAFCVTAFVMAHWFRAHFWYFQITQRKLGCTVAEWFDFLKGQ